MTNVGNSKKEEKEFFMRSSESPPSRTEFEAAQVLLQMGGGGATFPPTSKDQTMTISPQAQRKSVITAAPGARNKTTTSTTPNSRPIPTTTATTTSLSLSNQIKDPSAGPLHPPPPPKHYDAMQSIFLVTKSLEPQISSNLTPGPSSAIAKPATATASTSKPPPDAMRSVFLDTRSVEPLPSSMLPSASSSSKPTSLLQPQGEKAFLPIVTSAPSMYLPLSIMQSNPSGFHILQQTPFSLNPSGSLSVGNNNVSNSSSKTLRLSKEDKSALRSSLPLRRETPVTSIFVDGFEIRKEAWAKAFVQTDICHAAGILFKALFTQEEIQQCTLRGRNGTSLLNLQKRGAIFKAVGWMRQKNQNPYSFNDQQNYDPSTNLTPDERMMVEKKVFVERRYQTSRKIRESPKSSKRRRLHLQREQEDNYRDDVDFMHHHGHHHHRYPHPHHQQQQQQQHDYGVEDIVVKPEPMDDSADYYEGDYSSGNYDPTFAHRHLDVKMETEQDENEGDNDNATDHPLAIVEGQSTETKP